MIISNLLTRLNTNTRLLLLWVLGLIAFGIVLLGWYHSRLRVWQRQLATEQVQLRQERQRLEQDWQELAAALQQLAASQRQQAQERAELQLEQKRLHRDWQQLAVAEQEHRQRLQQAWQQFEAEQRVLEQGRQHLATKRERLEHELALLHEAQLQLEAARRQLAGEWEQFKTTHGLFAIPPLTWRNSLGMEFRLVPAGEFLMGSDDGQRDEQPVHQVRISQPFYLGTYEVTQQQWLEVMGENPSQHQDHPERPVENVSWEDVQEFIRRLNQRDSGTQYRLPTEAEWEYAARSGDGRKYPWGNAFNGQWLNFCDRRCTFKTSHAKIDDGHRQTAPVGSYEAGTSPFGVYDLAGNVWEWVQDRYGPYASGMVTDPHGPASGSNRVIRGGSWTGSSRCCRAADRYTFPPDTRSGNVGFRLLRTLEE